MAPYPGQARCLALGFRPECFRRLDVKGGRRPFPKETRSALDIEGKHVTIQGPSPDLSPATTLAPSVCATWLPSLQIRRYPRGRPDSFRSVRDLGRVPGRCSSLWLACVSWLLSGAAGGLCVRVSSGKTCSDSVAVPECERKTNMAPEQEALYALQWNVRRSEL